MTRQRFDKPWAFRRIIQRRPQPLHGVVQALLKVHKGVGWPELLLQFLSGDGLAGTMQEHGQDFHRLPLQPDLHAFFAEFPSLRIKLEHAKTESRRN